MAAPLKTALGFIPRTRKPQFLSFDVPIYSAETEKGKSLQSGFFFIPVVYSENKENILTIT